jgi:hypothetical protein
LFTLLTRAASSEKSTATLFVDVAVAVGVICGVSVGLAATTAVAVGVGVGGGGGEPMGVGTNVGGFGGDESAAARCCAAQPEIPAAHSPASNAAATAAGTIRRREGRTERCSSVLQGKPR